MVKLAEFAARDREVTAGMDVASLTVTVITFLIVAAFVWSILDVGRR